MSDSSPSITARSARRSDAFIAPTQPHQHLRLSQQQLGADSVMLDRGIHDLQRARQTAQRLAGALQLAPILRPEFRERRYGLFEGLTYEQSRTRYPDVYQLFEERVPDFVIPYGGESLQQLHLRVSAGLRRLVDEHPGQTIAVVTHGGVLDIVNRLVRGTSLRQPRDFLIPNAGINWVSASGDDWRMEAWGVTDHLTMVGLDELP